MKIMSVYCVNCQKMLSTKDGINQMVNLGYKPASNLIKRRVNYPFGKKSKPRVLYLSCKNCGGTEFKSNKSLPAQNSRHNIKLR